MFTKREKRKAVWVTCPISDLWEFKINPGFINRMLKRVRLVWDLKGKKQRVN